MKAVEPHLEQTPRAGTSTGHGSGGLRTAQAAEVSVCLGTQFCLSFLQRTRGTNTDRPLLTVTTAGELKAKSKTTCEHCSSKAEAPLTGTAPRTLVQAHSTCLAAGHGSCCLLRALAEGPDWLTPSVIVTNSCVGTSFLQGANAMGLVGLAKRVTIIIQQPLAEPPWLNRATTLGLFYTKKKYCFAFERSVAA